jgi:hypothetical protein
MDARECGLLPNGCMLFVQDNGVGGRTYTSDEIGRGVMIWDTALVDASSLLAAMTEESRICAREAHAKSNAVLPPPLKECFAEEGIDGSSPSAPTGRPDGYDGPEPTSSSGPLCTVCDMHSNQPGHWRTPCQWYVEKDIAYTAKLWEQDHSRRERDRLERRYGNIPW